METLSRSLTSGGKPPEVLGALFCFASLFLNILLSCAGTHGVSPSRASQIIENVRFYPQQEYQCGPASLAGVLNYWGVDVSPQRIATEIYSKAARGTLDIDMVLYAETTSLRVRHYKGSLEDARAHIDSGHPLIVLVDHGFWIYQRNHFMVVVGYDNNAIIVNSGKYRLKTLPLKGFLKSWGKTRFWTLLITPR